jgi:peptidyl-dipeptidase Dcp
VWNAFKNRGDNGDANDTKETIAQIVKLRAERARCSATQPRALAHGRHHGGDPERAMELMMRVWPAAVARVREEVADMQAIASARARNITIEPWDYLYYAEKVRQERYDPRPERDQAVLRAEQHDAGRLLDGGAAVRHDVPRDHRPGAGVPPGRARLRGARGRPPRRPVLLDNFARTGKRSGAWASTYRGHETFTGQRVTPLSRTTTTSCAARRASRC